MFVLHRTQLRDKTFANQTCGYSILQTSVKQSLIDCLSALEKIASLYYV